MLNIENIIQCLPAIKVYVSGELLKNGIKFLDEISKLNVYNKQLLEILEMSVVKL